MAALEKLPDELVGLVFTSAQDLYTAESLSTTNRRLRRIWLQNTKFFTMEILKSNIIAYEQAIDLATAEERLEGLALAPENPPIQRLLRNDDLAKSAVTAFQTWLEYQDEDSYRRQLTFDCPYTAYYLARKLVLAYRHPRAQLQSSLLETLRNSSLEVLHTNSELMIFLAGQASEDERMKHGIPMPEEDWPNDDECAMGGVNLPEWDYADDVVHGAYVDKRHGMQKLEAAINSVL